MKIQPWRRTIPGMVSPNGQSLTPETFETGLELTVESQAEMFQLANVIQSIRENGFMAEVIPDCIGIRGVRLHLKDGAVIAAPQS